MKRLLNKTLCTVLAIAMSLAFVPTTLAAPLTGISDTMSRLKAATASDHTIKFLTPTGVESSTDTITVTFPAGFTIGSVDYTDIDLSHGASTGYETEETLASSAGSDVWGALFSGQVLTLTAPTNAAAGEIAADDIVVVEIGLNASSGDAQITNPAANTYVIELGGTLGDSGKLAVAIISNDQFTVSAGVDPSITFTISASSTDFGTLSSTSVKSSSPSIDLGVSTNASGGYTITIQDAGNGVNPGLYSSENSFLIGSGDYSYANTADLSSVAGYGIQASSATATIDARYDQSGDNVGGYELTAQNLATYGNPADSHTITVTSKAKVSGSTPAGTYTDTVTVIATANF